MFKKVIVGVAVVVLSLGIALPASAAPASSITQAKALTPGILCIWFGWC